MIHNPELGNKVLPIIQKELGSHYEDSSWKNDTCDSVYSEQDDIIIYIPNTDTIKEGDCESFDTYAVTINFQLINVDEEIYSLPLKTLEETIAYVKESRNSK